MSMITSTAWVPRGCPKQIPTKAEFNQEEFDRIQDIANLQLEDAKEDLEKARQEQANGGAKEDGEGGVSLDRTTAEVDDDLKEYDLEHYDDSPDEDVPPDMEDEEESQPTDSLGMFGNSKNLVYHRNNEDDPYITLQGEDAESDDEREELQILPTDNVVVAGRVEDEVAHLEFYVYEDEADNLYVHHDVMLPAIPLCVTWLNAPIRKTPDSDPIQGNYIAVGTMDPDIEIWDLDTVDSMYPDLILGAGGNLTTKPPTGKKKKRKTPKSEPTHHTSSILALAPNKHNTSLLASASADSTIKLWDLSSASPSTAAASLSYHTDKVCALDWHPTQPTILLSGSYDRTVIASDVTATEEGGLGRRVWTLDADIESVAWDPHDENAFFATTESGVVWYFDARAVNADESTVGKTSKPLWRLQAHDGPVSAFAVNSSIPGFLATGSNDKVVKLWNLPVSDVEAGTTKGNGPTLINTRTLPDTGRIFSLNFAPDAAVAFRLAVAGSKGGVVVWDTSTNRAVRAAVGGKLANGDIVGGEIIGGKGVRLPEKEEGGRRDRIVGVEEGESSSSDGEGDEGGEEGNGEGGMVE